MPLPMYTLYIEQHYKKRKNPFSQKKFIKELQCKRAMQYSKGSLNLPAFGQYRQFIKMYDMNNHIYIIFIFIFMYIIYYIKHLIYCIKSKYNIELIRKGKIHF